MNYLKMGKYKRQMHQLKERIVEVTHKRGDEQVW